METIQLTDNQLPITITEKAFAQLVLSFTTEEGPPDYLRIGVAGGGCSGYTFILKFGKNEELDIEDDVLYSYQSLPVVVDVFSAEYLKKFTLDYVTTFQQSGFKFTSDSPSTRFCGCGESFNG